MKIIILGQWLYLPNNIALNFRLKKDNKIVPKN